MSQAEPLQFVAEDLPPYHFKDKSGETKGALVDIIKALAKEADIDYSIELYPFARAHHLLKANPNVLMFSLLKSPSRENEFLWLGKMYHNDAFLVSLKGSNQNVANLEQAKNHVVGTIRSYYSESYLRNAGFKEDGNMSLSVNYQRLWHMLFTNRIEFVLTNTLSLNTELSDLNLDVNDVERVIELTDFPSELHLAGNLSLSTSKAKALEQALKVIKENGQFQSILNNWGLN